MLLDIVSCHTQFCHQHLFEGVQLTDGFLSVIIAGLAVCVAFHLFDEHIVPALVVYERAGVDLAKYAGTATNHSYAMEAENLNTKYVLATFLHHVAQHIFRLFSKCFAWDSTEGKVLWDEDNWASFQSFFKESCHRFSGRSIGIRNGWTID